MRLAKLMVTLMVGAAACSGTGTDGREAGQEPPDHPLLDNLERPPQNDPLTIPSPGAVQDVSVGLPDDDLQALLVVLDDEPFTGALEASGPLALSAESIELRTERGRLQILFRTPPSMEAVTQPRGEGDVHVRELSDATGADRVVIVRDSTTVLLGELWKTAPDPLDVSVGDGLRLVQGTAEEASEGYTEVPVSLVERGNSLGELPLGKAVVMETELGRLQVYVEVAHLFRDSSEDEHEYILHAWLVGLR